MTTQTGTIENTDIVNAVRDYITNNNRPCPTDHLTRKFGEIAVEMLPAIKKDGNLVGLRGRNGGLMIPGMESLVKRKTPATAKTVTIEDSITKLPDLDSVENEASEDLTAPF